MSRIKLNTDQRPFIMIYHDFIESELLSNPYQVALYVCLKKFADKNNQCFPSLKKIAKVSKMSQRKAQETLKEFEEKHIITIENRVGADGGKSSNLYTLNDCKEIWNAEDIDEVEKILDEAEEKRMIDLLTAKGYCISKEKGLDSEPSKEQSQAPNNNNTYINENITDKPKSQEERYTLEEIRQLFDYKILLNDYPDRQQDVDCAMDVLHTTLNTSKPIIRVSGEDKPTMVVVSKLMKLNKDDIIYALDRFAEQTERVKNPTAYLLAILYSAKEQYHFDTINRVSHDMAHWEDKYHEKPRKAELERNLLQESSYLSLQQLNDKGRKHDRE